MVCRGLMLGLGRAGHIELPPARFNVRNHLAERPRPEPVVPDNRPTGPGHNAATGQRNQPVKESYGYPLCRNFRGLLSQ